MVWRRVRDSNPRFLLREHIISSDAPSTSRTTLRAIFQPNFSNLNLGKWREKLERKLFNVFNCIAKTPINQGLSRRGFQSDHWFSSQPRYDHFDNSPNFLCPPIIPHLAASRNHLFFLPRQNTNRNRGGILSKIGSFCRWISSQQNSIRQIDYLPKSQ